MHINSMPDLVLRLIFHKVPLQDLLWIGRVCLLWESYQLEIGEQVRSLTLLIGPTDTQSLITNSCFTLKYRDQLLNDDGTKMYSSLHLSKRLRLNYSSFSMDRAAELLNIFPRITTLEIAIKYVRGRFQLIPMVPLLIKWSPMLKSLKIYLEFNGTLPGFSHYLSRMNKKQETKEFVNLFEAINSMQSLEHLTLDADTEINPLPSIAFYLSIPGHLPNSNPIDLPILGRLREFYFKSDDKVEQIEKSLQSYAVSNDKLKQIGLAYSNIESIYGRYPELASKIVYLSLDVSAFNSPGVRDLLKSFSTLTKLILNPWPFENINNLSNDALKFISSLHQLTHLQLNTFNCAFFHSSQTFPDRLPQFASVQVLTIATELESTSDFETIHWAHLFPNVQVIKLTISTMYSELEICLEWHLTKQQLQQTLSPFVQCLKLHHIYTCENYSSEESEFDYKAIHKEWILSQEGDRKIIIQVEDNLINVGNLQ